MKQVEAGFLKDLYDLLEEDILACISYGAEMARERYFEYPVAVH